MKLKPKTKVTTTWGPGVIKDYDLPETNSWRYMIELENGAELCFFPSEVEEVKDE